MNYPQDTIAKAKTGTYIGMKNEKGTITFKGIRYGSFQGRWKPLADLPESDAVMEAFELGPACPQTYLIPGAVYDAPFPRNGELFPYSEEDCFSLGISTSSLNGKKPVFVFIHGGANTFGGCFDPTFRTEAFVDFNPDIVFVVINYRVSFLGHIYLGEIDPDGIYKESTNIRAMDQTQALKWVYENIAAFGGDPKNITIGGQSAGAFNEEILMAYPPSRKYYKRAILQSCSVAIDQSMSREKSAKITRKIMDAIGVTTLEELVHAPVEDVLRQEHDLWSMNLTNDPGVIPNVFQTLCSEIPGESISGIDIMFGTTESEFEPPMTAETTPDEIRPMIHASVANFLRGMPECTARKFIESYMPDVTDIEAAIAYVKTISDEDVSAILDTYIENDPNRAPIIALTDCLNDFTWWQPSVILAKELCKRNRLYMYQWTWCKPNTYPNRAKHAIELGFMTGNTDLPNDPANGCHPQNILNLAMQLWGNFIRTGVPDCELLKAKPYTNESPEIMRIDETPEYYQDYRFKDLYSLQTVYRKKHQ